MAGGLYRLGPPVAGRDSRHFAPGMPMRPTPSGPTGGDSGHGPSSAILAALSLLQRARDAAADLHLDPWEFAVSLTDLLAAGLTGTDVRRLVADGLAEHAHERVRPGVGHRSVRRMANLALTARTCFILTPAGERLLSRWTGHPAANGNGSGPKPPAPRWDADRRQLWFREQLVKCYRVPAASQETILAAFEEDGWPPRIDDPLGHINGHDPQERLHEAVKGLNRGQMRRLLVFHRDGSGEGVTWRAIQGQ